MSKKQNLSVNYKVLKVNTSNFSFEEIPDNDLEKLFKDGKNLQLKVNIRQTFNLEESAITVDVVSKLLNTLDGSTLISHTGRTIFLVKNLEKYKINNSDLFDLPENFIVIIYGLAFTHARALLAVEISPTAYKDHYILPLIDPAIFLKKVAPTSSQK